MPSRQEELLDAAIAVVGGHGVRRLTHRAVDAEAGVPAGSTSNYFRTRKALLAAVVRRVAARERSAWEAIAGALGPVTADDLAAALASFVRDATGPGRTLTLARHALFVEAALHPDLQAELRATVAGIRAWGSRSLGAAGSADPERDWQIVLDALDGLLIHQLAFPDPTFDPRPRLATLIGALCDAATANHDR